MTSERVKSETVTPGPWEISKIGNNYDQYSIYAEDGANHGRGTNVCNAVEGEANALLIAAAPDLLKASRDLMEELRSRFDYVEPTPEESAALCKMEAAIAKGTIP